MLLTSADHLQAGLAEHRAGNLSAAALHYCKTLEQAPSDADALHLLGLLLSEKGEHGRALALLSRAVELRPNAVYLANLGLACRRAGDVEAAITAYHEALRLNPRHAPTLGKLGRALIEAGRPAEAERTLEQALLVNGFDPELHNVLGHAHAATEDYANARIRFSRALTLDPAFAEARDNLASALLRLGHIEACNGQWDSAGALYSEARQLAPGLANAWYHSGLAAMALNRPAEAAAHYRQAITLEPAYAEAHNNLGHVQQAAGDTAAALQSYERALLIRPGYLDARYNLALTLQNSGRISQAETHYGLLLEQDPAHADTLNNMGGIRLGQNRLHDAKRYLERALTDKPTHVDARWNLALAHLTMGDFALGWPLYEARLEQPSFPQRQFECPRWRGESLTDKRIFVWAEQGLGDTIQFMRYLPLLTAAGAQVVFEVQERLRPFLAPLLSTQSGIEVRARGAAPETTDWHIPLLSLPGTHGGIPPVWQPGIVSPAPLSHLPGRKIGLCWAGHPHHVKGKHRSIPLAQLAPLGDLDGITLLSLQRGPQEAEVNELTGSWRPVRAEAEDGGIADLASIIAGLDLVITVDTMVAHLAGTLGKPVWTLLPFAADWRWMLDREDSPWYPGMRLFRQPAAGDWASVVNRLLRELRPAA